MTLQDRMKRLLDDTPGLNLVAFGDLSSGLVLNSVSKTACPREVLDLLCEKAVDCFAMLGPDALSSPDDPGIFGRAVIHFDERGTQVFARQPANPDDVICAMCEPGTALEPMLQATLDLASKVGGPQ